MYNRARAICGVLLVAGLLAAPPLRGDAQIGASGSLPDITPEQAQQILGARDGQTNQGPSSIPETTILEPLAPATLPSPPSRLEQILSARAGVKLSLFGYDELGSGRAVSLPQVGGLQDNYVLGPGDEILVTLRGQQNAEYRIVVDRDGRVALPRLIPISAAGVSLGQFRQTIIDAVHRAYPSTEAYVTVGRLRQISVVVTGEVGSPGVRTLTGLSTPLDAILVSGGIRKTGSLRNVRLIRQGRTTVIDLYSILTSGTLAGASALADGDRILVPPLTRVVAAAGWFRRPAIYELPPGTSAISARSLEALAGGLEVRGRYRLSVSQIESSGRTRLVTVTAPTNLVRDGEVLLALPAADQSVGQAMLAGGTGLAGAYSITKGMRLSELLQAPGALGATPYAIFGVISRQDPRTRLRFLIAFSPAAVTTGEGDISLLDDDIVRVFSMNEGKLLSRAVSQYEKKKQHSEEAVRNPYLASTEQERMAEAVARTGQTANQLSSQVVSPDATQTVSSSEDQQFGASAPGTGQSQQPNPYQRYATPSGATAAQAAAAAQGEVETTQGFVGYGDQSTPEPDGYGGQRTQELNTYEGQRMPPPGALTGVPSGEAQIYPNANQSALNPERQPAPNFEQEIAAAGAMPQNVAATSIEEIASQIRIDTPILISFLEDHEVTLDGAVRAPGVYVVGPGVNLHDLVIVAGGTARWADESGVELITTDVDKASGRATTLRKTLALNDADLSTYQIRPHDELRFREVFNDVGLGSVILEGEVRFPGEYKIVRGERLADLLKRAGGLTEVAYPFGTVYLRRSAAALEEESFRRTADQIESQLLLAMSRNSSAPKLDPAAFTATQTFVEKLRTQKGLGRISIVADPAILADQPEQNTLLEGGDVIYVPQRPSTVSVLGEVLQPGSFVYREHFSAEDYLAKAGGTTAYADDSLTFIVLPDGSAIKLDRPWLPFDSQRVPVGSTIVVPRDIAPLQWSDVISNATQIFSQMAVAGASLAVISSNLK
ncbi:MAG TPA: SLBB domain-containing protein [Rhizomicrobium sp.]|nr:SLBB domain-containing protein [Rhizomicrobium sp.]